MDENKPSPEGEFYKNLWQVAQDCARQTLKLRAADDAIVAVLRKHAERLGVSPDQIVKEFREEYDERYARLLVKSENVDPGIAAQLDDRPLPGLESDS